MDDNGALAWFMDACGLPARSKKMFGGLGVFADDVMFALIHGGVIYMKSTGEMSAEYVDGGYQFEPPFRKGMKMPYWNVPVDLSTDRVSEWAGKSLAYAKATKK